MPNDNRHEGTLGSEGAHACVSCRALQHRGGGTVELVDLIGWAEDEAISEHVWRCEAGDLEVSVALWELVLSVRAIVSRIRQSNGSFGRGSQMVHLVDVELPVDEGDHVLHCEERGRTEGQEWVPDTLRVANETIATGRESPSRGPLLRRTWPSSPLVSSEGSR